MLRKRVSKVLALMLATAMVLPFADPACVKKASAETNAQNTGKTEYTVEVPGSKV